ncbi:formin-like protein 14 isoform X2 [Micropterus dolomieu]|uniref:formin-like protein 14 isoform X2 n=1 Tax=Micropterus dolomieu TaxID=147949 RepID=UPI001E8DACD0|nr:formin-like protein 14 isoform X2 [Micropterus dolomieu]
MPWKLRGRRQRSSQARLLIAEELKPTEDTGLNEHKVHSPSSSGPLLFGLPPRRPHSSPLLPPFLGPQCPPALWSQSPRFPVPVSSSPSPPVPLPLFPSIKLLSAFGSLSQHHP